MPRVAMLTPGSIQLPYKSQEIYREKRLRPAPRLPTHQGLPMSISLQIVKMLDSLEIRGCDHCADLRYALVAYVQGLVPLDQRVVPDETYLVNVNGLSETHVRRAQTPA